MAKQQQFQFAINAFKTELELLVVNQKKNTVVNKTNFIIDLQQQKVYTNLEFGIIKGKRLNQ